MSSKKLAVCVIGMICLGGAAYFAATSFWRGTPGPVSPDSVGGDSVGKETISKQVFIERTIGLYRSSMQVPADSNPAPLALIEQELQKHLPTGDLALQPGWEQSIQRLLRTEKSQLLDPKTGGSEGAARFVALWILEGVYRPEMKPEDRKRMDEQFAELLALYTEGIRGQLSASASSRVGLDGVLEETIKKMQEAVNQKYAQLRDDPMFPAFKEPWSETDMEGIKKAIAERNNDVATIRPMPNLGGSPSTTQRASSEAEISKYYGGKYMKYGMTYAGMFMDTVTMAQAYRKMDRNDWWGRCMWGTGSKSPFEQDDTWPFSGGLSPAPAGLQ